MFYITQGFLKRQNATDSMIDWFKKQGKPNMSISDWHSFKPSWEQTSWLAEQLNHITMNLKDNRFDTEMLNAFIALKNAETFCLAGIYWNDERYDIKILDALLKTGHATWLYAAGNVWRNERYDIKIAEVLLKNGNFIHISMAQQFWLPSRLTPELMEWRQK